MTVEKQDLLELTTEIVAAFVGKNMVPADQLPELIQGVHRSLSSVEAMGQEVPQERPKPAVPIRKSVEHHIVPHYHQDDDKKVLEGCSINQKEDGVLEVFWKEPTKKLAQEEELQKHPKK